MAISNSSSSISMVEYDTGGGRYAVAYGWYQGPGANVYAAGGEAGLARALGVSEIKNVIASPGNIASQDYGLVWDSTTRKLKWVTEGAEVADNTDLSALSFQLRVDCIL